MEGYHFNFPDEIKLILTTGKEEGLAAYCRKTAIILTEEKVKWPYRDLEYLINHELFHIYSYHNPVKRWELYEFLGFHRCQGYHIIQRRLKITSRIPIPFGGIVILN